MISMLQSGKNGEQILAILNTLTGDNQPSEYNEPTLDSIEFWYQSQGVLCQFENCPWPLDFAFDLGYITFVQSISHDEQHFC